MLNQILQSKETLLLVAFRGFLNGVAHCSQYFLSRKLINPTGLLLVLGSGVVCVVYLLLVFPVLELRTHFPYRIKHRYNDW